MKITPFATALAAIVVNSCALALQLGGQTASAITATYFRGDTTSWVGPRDDSIGLVESYGSTTFLYNAADPDASKVEFMATFVTPGTNGQNLNQQVCFERGSGRPELCIQQMIWWNRKLLTNKVYDCPGIASNGACLKNIGTQAHHQYNDFNGDGNWTYEGLGGVEDADRPDAFTDFEIYHQPDSQIYKFIFRIPVGDLPDQTALQSLSGQPVELTGRHWVFAGNAKTAVTAPLIDFRVAPASTTLIESAQAEIERQGQVIADQSAQIDAMTDAKPVLEIYDDANCQGVHYDVAFVEGGHTSFNISWFTAAAVKVRPNFIVEASVNSNWEGLFGKQEASGDELECQTLPQGWQSAPDLYVRQCEASKETCE